MGGRPKAARGNPWAIFEFGGAHAAGPCDVAATHAIGAPRALSNFSMQTLKARGWLRCNRCVHCLPILVQATHASSKPTQQWPANRLKPSQTWPEASPNQSEPGKSPNPESADNASGVRRVVTSMILEQVCLPPSLKLLLSVFHPKTVSDSPHVLTIFGKPNPNLDGSPSPIGVLDRFEDDSGSTLRRLSVDSGSTRGELESLRGRLRVDLVLRRRVVSAWCRLSVGSGAIRGKSCADPGPARGKLGIDSGSPGCVWAAPTTASTPENRSQRRSKACRALVPSSRSKRSNARTAMASTDPWTTPAARGPRDDGASASRMQARRR